MTLTNLNGIGEVTSCNLLVFELGYFSGYCSVLFVYLVELGKLSIGVAEMDLHHLTTWIETKS